MLELAGLTRSFGDRRVLDDVGFAVERGRLTGFVGANGAGKTTTMRIVLGVLEADAGTVSLDGAPLDTALRRRFGYMPEERGLYPKMRVGEQLAYLGRLHGLDADGARRNTDRLLTRLEIEQYAQTHLEKLSLGNQQRAQIAASLVHEPDVLVLDEPFSGLDPLAVQTVQSVLQDYADRGVPVLFSSHQLDIVERLCDDLVIIADGRIRAAGEAERLREQHSRPRYEIRVAGDTAWIRDVPGVTVVESDDERTLFESDATTAQSVLKAATDRGTVTSFAPHRPPLSQIFREVIQ